MPECLPPLGSVQFVRIWNAGLDRATECLHEFPERFTVTSRLGTVLVQDNAFHIVGCLRAELTSSSQE